MANINYGKVANLTIGQRAPLIEMSELRGPKTLYVRCRPNWPDALGNYPLIPMDIEIIVRNKVGAILAEDTVCLPALGMSMPLQGDGLEVFAYYSPKQALAIPYVSYELEAGLVAGPEVKTPSKFYWTAPLGQSFNITYPVAPSPVPWYSSLVRVSTDSMGVLMLSSINGVTFEYYDFGAAREFCSFNPDCSLWQIINYFPTGSTNASVGVEFL
jgi:hypothetical protein